MHHFETRPQERADRLFGLHARVKLVVGLILLTFVIVSKGTVFPVSIALFCFAAAAWTGVPVRDYLLRFGEPVFIAAVLVFLKAFSAGNHLLYSLDIGSIHMAMTLEGLTEGLRLAGRILGAVSVLVLIGMTTPLVNLLSALSWLKVPKTFIEILVFAYRYIFVLFDDARVVYASQKNRLGYTGVLRRLRSFGALAGAVLLRSLEQSTNTTTAMVQRGYTGKVPLTDDSHVHGAQILHAVILLLLLSGYFLAAEGLVL